MNRIRCFLTTLGLLALTATAGAQPPAYAQPPGYVPSSRSYFPLLRGGSPTVNYYGFVRPQRAAEAGFQAVDQQFNAFSRASAAEREDLTTEGIRPTGRAATFMNLGHYYPPRTGVAGRTMGGRR
jgi:hypothetical protein